MSRFRLAWRKVFRVRRRQRLSFVTASMVLALLSHVLLSNSICLHRFRLQPMDVLYYSQIAIGPSGRSRVLAARGIVIIHPEIEHRAPSEVQYLGQW